jgi:uncharacterized repeat protein (TIGR01451 family)
MKTFTLTLLFQIGIFSTTQAQMVNIPDANFKAALLSNYIVIDTNGDGEIQVSEATAYHYSLDVSWKNISDLTGIEEFINLTSLDCYNNQLTSLDLSNNTSLYDLHCEVNQLTSLNISNNTSLTAVCAYYNQLTSLDVSTNTFLTNLDCDYNQLTNLDVSNNTALYLLSCSYNHLIDIELSANDSLVVIECDNNQLTNLDVSVIPNLQNLICNNNLLINLDLSNNTSLINLLCYANQLTSLNLRNGNNINMDTIYADNNPNLTCIQVDDAIYSSNNWIYFDSDASFGENCLYDIGYPNTISGNVLKDDNCLIDAIPQGFENIIVRTEPYSFYGVTDSLGNYTVSTDTGTYQVNQLLTNPLISQLCPMPNYHTVVFDTLAQDTTDINFFNKIIECPLLTVDLNSDRRRRCFTNNTYVEYCNTGFADASGVEVMVQMPEYVILVFADYPYTVDTSGNYIFDIGNLEQGECGNIHIIDSVACELNITDLTQCTKAWITPKNDCADSLSIGFDAWDKSSVMVTGECHNDTLVSYTITNTGDFGDGDMEAPQEYRIYVDNALALTETFQLNGGGSINIDYPANGQTIRLEADQHPMHPGNSHPQETIEACGENNGQISTGFVNTMPIDDEDYDVEIDCLPIIDSFDPNDKSVSPSGITENHYLQTGTLLDYQIRFQNTGTDTAFTVVVIDTLSEYLNPSTIQWGVSSHIYTIDVSGMGNPILRFTFNSINLPDSTTNELSSHGFVKFKVAPYDTLPNGTQINNTANIYFDYNLPMITNTSQIIISDSVLIYSPLIIETISNENINIYPNPTSGIITIKAKDILQVEIYSISGVLIKTTNKKEIDLRNNAKGLYFVKVIAKETTITKRIILK